MIFSRFCIYIMFFGTLMSGVSLPLYAHEYDTESSEQYYGRAHHPDFHRAIEHGADEMSARERAELAALIPKPETNRYYARIRTNFSDIKIKGLENTTQTGNQVGLSFLKDESESSQMVWELALGYVWDTTRLDVECLINKNLQ